MAKSSRKLASDRKGTWWPELWPSRVENSKKTRQWEEGQTLYANTEVFAVVGGLWNGFQGPLLPGTQEKSPFSLSWAGPSDPIPTGYCKSCGMSFPRGGYKMISFLSGLGFLPLSCFLTLLKQDSKYWVAIQEGQSARKWRKPLPRASKIQPSVRPPVRSWILPIARLNSKAYTSAFTFKTKWVLLPCQCKFSARQIGLCTVKGC